MSAGANLNRLPTIILQVCYELIPLKSQRHPQTHPPSVSLLPQHAPRPPESSQLRHAPAHARHQLPGQRRNGSDIRDEHLNEAGDEYSVKVHPALFEYAHPGGRDSDLAHLPQSIELARAARAHHLRSPGHPPQGLRQVTLLSVHLLPSGNDLLL